MIKRRIFAAGALLCALLIPAHAQAQSTKAQINTLIGTSFPDNNVGAITPTVLRNVANTIVNSIMPTAPVTAGNFVCFSGTTGLLRDCANATLTISPPAGTTNKGLAITQTLPATGAPVGPILGNTIDVTNPGLSAGGTGTVDAFGARNLIYSQRNTMSVTGASSSAGSSALGAITNIAAPSDGFGGALGVTVTGASPAGHYMWGGISYAIGFSNSASGALIGHEAEVGLGTGGTTSYRIGVAANSQGPVKGSTLDAAFSANVINNILPGSSTTSAPFEHLMALSGNLYGTGQFPISTTGDLLFSDVSGTIGNGINLPGVAVTGNILSFPNMAVGGNGTGVFGAGAASLPGVGITATCASCGIVQVAGVTNSTTGASGVTSKDVTGNNVMFNGVFGASATGTRFGQTTANWGEIITTGSTNAGLLIGTVNSAPLIFGTNNTFAGKISTGRQWEIGADAAPDSLLTVNNNTAAATPLSLSVDAHLVGADGVDGGVLSDVYGGEALFVGRAASGTQGTKAARLAASPFLALLGRTWDGSAYNSNAVLEFLTVNLQSGTDHSSRARLRLVPSGSTTITDVMLWGPGVAIGSGAADPGAGSLNVLTSYYQGGTLLKNVAETLTNKTISGASNTLSNIASASLSNTTVTAAAYGSATASPTFTVNAQGQLTAAANVTITPAIGSITGLGTGIATALGVNTGSAGAPVLFNGAGGTPSSITLTNASGTAASLTAGNVTTNANLTGDVTSVGNATTLTNAPVIAKVLTGFTSGAGTVSAADSILSALQKIDGNVALKAPLASPALTGAPTAPTAAVDTNTTQLATTAMVLGQAASATPLGDGTAAVGTSTRYARGDHVHPIDTHMGLLQSVSITGVNFNSANSDNAIAITLPPGFTRFVLLRLHISNASASLTTSTFGLFPATAGSGTAMISAGTACTVSSSSDGAAANVQAPPLATAVSFVAASLATPNTIYFRIGTPQGSAATATVTAYYFPLP